ncbi:MAG TPA: 16S rRNA (cytosine(967)-C(5))-methyltransferase RsmB, partial [Candidatus Hydrogenedentes bacterium]|nr:16S rRNA (cytosine(967)-C(5))-methyltransferase RsmB [Candidatus Hydrogenedentota bacterium]
WRVTAEAPARMASLQRDLLRSALALCKNGGVVVYSVCTFTPEETDEVVEACLAEGGVEAEDGPKWLNPHKIQQGRYRTSPLDGALDGFFLTRLRKVS